MPSFSEKLQQCEQTLSRETEHFMRALTQRYARCRLENPQHSTQIHTDELHSNE